MKTHRLAAAPALVALVAGLCAVCGCNKKPIVPLVGGNQPPTVRITSAPLDTTSRNYYVITVNWTGFDPDGRVDHFLLAVDPPKDPGADTLWETTTQNQLTRSFPCPLPDRRDSTRSSDFHIFVIKAVDNRGAVSPPVSRAFWSYTVAPSVQIIDPRPSALFRRYVTPAVLIRWEGRDEDGVFTKKPVKYKFKMLTDVPGQTEVTLSTARSRPDSVRRYYAPRNWAGWDSTGADTTQKQFTNLTPDQDYLFVVIAFDEAGAYSPIFSLNNNMLYMRVTFAGSNNPKIGFFNEFFLYEYQSGSYQPNNPGIEIPLEVPAGRPGHVEDRITFNWYATAIPGSAIRSYRWAVDILDLADETERTDEETDLAHWSPKSILVTSCRIGPYPGGETHKLYLEAEDINGLKSLGVVRFSSVLASFEKELLIVDDTRLPLYTVQPGTLCTASLNRPLGAWPSQAELDTFLYAVGGKPWTCYPTGTISTPGLFNGYRFDTLGTNLRIADLSIRLSKLGQYKHVLWLTDGRGALNFKSGTDQGDLSGPQTAMRYMNQNRQANTVATYVRQGGQVWLAGGGAAVAALINFNKQANDETEPRPVTKTFRDTDGELVPGRFIYDQAHWRTEFKQWPLNNGRILRHLGRFRDRPGIYAGLPEEMQAKDPSTDDFPPNRAPVFSNFYINQFELEFLSAPNEILEDLDPGPAEDLQSTLDTLYLASARSLQPDSVQKNVVMTYYHGGDNTPFILTGFNLWTFRRTQCQQLVDFVLQQLWGFAPPVPALAGGARLARPGSLAAGQPRSWSPPAKPRAAPAQHPPLAAPAATGPRD